MRSKPVKNARIGLFRRYLDCGNLIPVRGTLLYKEWGASETES